MGQSTAEKTPKEALIIPEVELVLTLLFIPQCRSSSGPVCHEEVLRGQGDPSWAAISEEVSLPLLLGKTPYGAFNTYM